jgi:hypothetical protein
MGDAAEPGPEPAMQRSVELAAGTLRLSISRSDVDFDRLCGFGSRRNLKRGYLFVSKVLGKHIPADPLVMDEMFARLAAKPVIPERPVLFVGLAETATGLAQGVYEHYVRSNGAAGTLLIHTTRRRFDRPVLAEFLEPHSHLPQHIVYSPVAEAHRELLHSAQTLVLIDDELSTGVTLSNLAARLREAIPSLRRVHVVSLKDWLDEQARREFGERAGMPAGFHSLVRGTFTFEANPEYRLPVAAEVRPRAAAESESVFETPLGEDYGRFGAQGPLAIEFDVERITRGLRPGARVLVLGTGEFNYPPFLLARDLAVRGFDVRFQSTTRSPVLLGHDILSVAEFDDREYGGGEFVYNVTDKSYDRILIGYEAGSRAGVPPSAAALGAVPLFFLGGRSSPLLSDSALLDSAPIESAS